MTSKTPLATAEAPFPRGAGRWFSQGQVRVAARKEVSASTIPKQLFCIRPAMQASAGRDPSLLPVVPSMSDVDLAVRLCEA
jgi:hypothetical protein